MRVSRVLGVVGLVVLAAAGCGGPSAVDRAAPSPCETRVAAKNPADTVTVVLFDKVDLAHAPWGQNREERFVFSHLYETLITIDCHGEIRPGLAKSWHRSSDGWLIELREDAEFWDESPVTAEDVVASFQPAIRSGIAIGSVDAVNKREVLVSRADGDVDIKLLALQMLSVTRKSESTGQTMGTGPWRLDENESEIPGMIVMRASRGPRGAVVRFLPGIPRHVRDMFGGSVDAMITDDPAAIEYASSTEGTSLAALAWDRAYVLLSRSRALKLAQRENVEYPPPSLVDALARNAVQVDARGGSVILTKAAAAAMGRPVVYDSPARSASELAPRIVYMTADPTSRGLAERLVALAAMNPASSPEASAIARVMPDAPAGMRAVGADLPDFELILSRGHDVGYVFSLSWCADFPFLTYRFAERAPWLFTSSIAYPRDALVPLVETRAHFIAMSDRIGFVDKGNGDIRILNPATEPSP